MEAMILTFLRETGFSEDQITHKFGLWLGAFKKYDEKRVGACLSKFLESQETYEKPTISNVLKRMPSKQEELSPQDIKDRAFFIRKSEEYSDLALANLQSLKLSFFDFITTDKISSEKKMELINIVDKQFINQEENDVIKKLRQMGFFEDL